MAQLNKFTDDDIKKTHGDINMYRALYEGKHYEVFPRAKQLIRQGEIIGAINYGSMNSSDMKVPYVMANISKMIVDVPSMFINRSLGKVLTNKQREFEEFEENEEITIEELEVLKNQQQEYIDNIVDNTNLTKWNSMNLKQWQIDGGIVAVPEIVNGNPRIAFKERTAYYELDDGVTFQMRYLLLDEDDNKYLHVHEEVEHDNYVEGTHTLYSYNNTATKLTEVEDNDIIQELTNINPENRHYILHNRNKTLFVYLPFEPTFDNQMGNSAIKGQEGKQDEVNWTLTRTAQVFERNGRPRVAIPKDVFREIQDRAEERYGDRNKIDNQDLEVTSIDEDGQSIRVLQIDTDKIGDVSYLKNIIKLMLMETQTSEKAIDFFNTEGSSYAESGTAKFYDLFLSIMKAEKLRDEYVDFLQRALKNCLWLYKQVNNKVEIECPDIKQSEMLPITSKERREMNNTSYQAGTQSLEQTIKNINPEKTDAWVENELEKIEGEKSTVDSFSLFNGNQTSRNFNDNRNEDGQHIDEDGNVIEE
jgi:hypothetical protein